MKVLHKKLKKVSKIKKFFYHVTNLAYLGTFIFLTYILLVKLRAVNEPLKYAGLAILGIWFLIYLLTGLVAMLTKKNKTFVIFTLITLMLAGGVFAGSKYIMRWYNKGSGVTAQKEGYTSTFLIKLKGKNFDKSMAVGYIPSNNEINPTGLMKKYGINKKYDYETVDDMLADLFDGKIAGAIVGDGYESLSNPLLDDSDGQEHENSTIKNLVEVVYTYEEKTKNAAVQETEASKNKKLTEPFTVLIMGVDSAKDGLKPNQAFNGDTLILITFNPKTLTATMFSLPRDLYVPIACNNNRYAKINSSAAYGSSCVIKTIKNLTDIDIDFYVKINFKGVVQLIDTLGGVDVDVQAPTYDYYSNAHNGRICEQDSLRRKGSHLICIDPGMQHLNGEQALAYARCRHGYLESDLARNRHQQEVITAMTKEVRKIRSISQIEEILDVISNNIETNMSVDQILSFYDVGKSMLSGSNTNELAIKKTAISTYPLRVWRGKAYTSALGYYQESLDKIIDLMKQNLELKSAKADYSFEFHGYNGYVEKVTGKNVFGEKTLTTLASYIGSSQSYASDYCIKNKISCTFEYRDSDQPYGIIIDQSVHDGVLLRNVSSVTFYMSNAALVNKPVTPVDPGNQGGSNPEPDNPGGNGSGGTENPPEPDDPGNNGGGGGNENPPEPDTPTEPDTPSEDGDN